MLSSQMPDVMSIWIMVEYNFCQLTAMQKQTVAISYLSTGTTSIASTILQTTARAPSGIIEPSNDKIVEPQIISKTEGLVCMHVLRCFYLLQLKMFKF